MVCGYSIINDSLDLIGSEELAMYNDTGIHVMGGAGHVQMYIRSVHVIY
jgi:hypothetical protein